MKTTYNPWWRPARAWKWVYRSRGRGRKKRLKWVRR
jgi:hypothetical protein